MSRLLGKLLRPKTGDFILLQSGRSIRDLIGKLENVTRRWNRWEYKLKNYEEDLDDLVKLKAMGLDDRVNTSQLNTDKNLNRLLSIYDALNANGLKLLTAPPDWQLPFADLNAAAAGTYKKTFRIVLQNKDDVIQQWADYGLKLTPTENVADVDVGVPTLTMTRLGEGQWECEIEFDTDAGATKTYAASVAATGDVTCVAGSVSVDGDNFVIPDADKSVTYEFRLTGTATPGNVQVDILAGNTAIQNADALRAAMVAEQSAGRHRVTPDAAASATVALTQDRHGPSGNQAITENINDVGGTKTDFTGGAGTIDVKVQSSSDGGATGDDKTPTQVAVTLANQIFKFV